MIECLFEYHMARSWCAHLEFYFGALGLVGLGCTPEHVITDEAFRPLITRTRVIKPSVSANPFASQFDLAQGRVFARRWLVQTN